MNRILIFLGLASLGTILSCVYGVLHDQITYTISPEFYHLIRFPKYEIPLEAGRWGVVRVAIINTWSIGLLVSVVVAFAGLIHSNNPKIIRYTLNAFALAMSVAIFMSLVGYAFGRFNQNQMSKLADHIIGKENFLIVQTIHNFTYIGSLLGMLGAIYFQFFRRKRNRMA